MIKFKFTEYLKDAAMYKPMRTEEPMEVDEKTFYDFINVMGYKKTPNGYFWKRTAYDRGEKIEIVSE